MPKIRVFADTNVILESFRTGCWTAISSQFAVETVEKCVEETLIKPGDPTRSDPFAQETGPGSGRYSPAIANPDTRRTCRDLPARTSPECPGTSSSAQVTGQTAFAGPAMASTSSIRSTNSPGRSIAPFTPMC